MVQRIENITQPINPDTTVIVFDLHNVVFKKQTTKMVTSVLKLKGSFKYTLNPLLWYKVYRLKASSSVAEDIFFKITQQYPGLKPYRDDFIQITNKQKPIKKVMALIKQLKERGYHLFVLSNIGKDTYNQLVTAYPELGSYFSGAYTSSAEINYAHKPHAIFYEQFKEYLNDAGHEQKQIIFIDDLKKNIVAAQECNIAGLHYSSAKKLEAIFKKLSIL